MAPKADAVPDVVDDDAPGPPISVPDSGDTGEGGKLKMIIQLVKKCLGVKDIASMRLSLPASLLEPMPNLEYWQYLDRPDLFAAINDSPDALDRMLAVMRFALTKDLKFIHGKICKPYNSVLGEHFRTHWDILPVASPVHPDHPPLVQMHTTDPKPPSAQPVPLKTPAVVALASETDSVRSIRSTHSTISATRKSPSTAATSPQQLADTKLEAGISKLDLGDATSADASADGRIRVVFVTEQVSHHPPISAYHAFCPAKHLELRGIDQIAAKVSGTTLRVAPGEHNKGIFVGITGGFGEGEEYRITHPIASVNGILRGSFYVTIGESTIITCSGGKPGLKFRTILEYKEESWLGKAHYYMEGVVHTVHEGDDSHEEWTRVKHVPKSRVVAMLDGTWRGLIRWRRSEHFAMATSSVASSPSPSHTTLPVPDIPANASSKAELSRPADSEWVPLLDVSTLQVVPKTTRPVEKQLPHESQKLWEKVTTLLLKKEFSEATKEKIAIEQKQRDEAAERKKLGIEFVPRYFEQDLEHGYSKLTEAGRKAIEEELSEPSS